MNFAVIGVHFDWLLFDISSIGNNCIETGELKLRLNFGFIAFYSQWDKLCVGIVEIYTYISSSVLLSAEAFKATFIYIFYNFQTFFKIFKIINFTPAKIPYIQYIWLEKTIKSCKVIVRHCFIYINSRSICTDGQDQL